MSEEMDQYVPCLSASELAKERGQQIDQLRARITTLEALVTETRFKTLQDAKEAINTVLKRREAMQLGIFGQHHNSGLLQAWGLVDELHPKPYTASALARSEALQALVGAARSIKEKDCGFSGECHPDAKTELFDALDALDKAGK